MRSEKEKTGWREGSILDKVAIRLSETESAIQKSGVKVFSTDGTASAESLPSQHACIPVNFCEAPICHKSEQDKRPASEVPMWSDMISAHPSSHTNTNGKSPSQFPRSHLEAWTWLKSWIVLLFKTTFWAQETDWAKAWHANEPHLCPVYCSYTISALSCMNLFHVLLHCWNVHSLKGNLLILNLEFLAQCLAHRVREYLSNIWDEE